MTCVYPSGFAISSWCLNIKRVRPWARSRFTSKCYNKHVKYSKIFDSLHSILNSEEIFQRRTTHLFSFTWYILIEVDGVTNLLDRSVFGLKYPFKSFYFKPMSRFASLVENYYRATITTRRSLRQSKVKCNINRIRYRR